MGLAERMRAVGGQATEHMPGAAAGGAPCPAGLATARRVAQRNRAAAMALVASVRALTTCARSPTPFGASGLSELSNELFDDSDE